MTHALKGWGVCSRGMGPWWTQDREEEWVWFSRPASLCGGCEGVFRPQQNPEVPTGPVRAWSLTSLNTSVHCEEQRPERNLGKMEAMQEQEFWNVPTSCI